MLQIHGDTVHSPQAASAPIPLAGLAAVAPPYEMDQALARRHCAAVLAADKLPQT